MLNINADVAFLLGVVVGATYGALMMHWYLERRSVRRLLRRLKEKPPHGRGGFNT